MVQVSYPGVYSREISSGVRTISGVSTSIALFVGMAKRGVIDKPTRVLGFAEYERIYSSDTSLGEMTDQVRQFFLNGGEQAYIVRVAEGHNAASVGLDGPAGTVITLEARDAGGDGNSLRARVDFDTSSPESTFNLTVFREVFDASGLPVIEQTESFSDLGMSPTGARYVQTIVNQQSSLVRASVDEALVDGAAVAAAYSASARVFADDAAAETAIGTAIANASPTGAQGAFRIRVGTSPTLTIAVAAGTNAPSDIQTSINTALAPHLPGVTVAVTVGGAAGPLRFTASAAGHDVHLSPAPQLDIASELGLGVAQGGVESSSYSATRPFPSMLVSEPGADLSALLSFGDADKGALDALAVLNVQPFGPVPQANIGYPVAAGSMLEGTQSGQSLLNVRENLEAIANALSAASDHWRAEVHGYRLALIPTFGDASSGSGAAFQSATPNLGAANEIFDTTGRRAAEPLAGGLDGSMPQLAQYADAYARVDSEVDLFNILILPRSAEDTGFPSVRSTAWGPASAFCHRKRAFLLVDANPAPGSETPAGMLTEINNLRVGVVKDHAAVYWPKITISSDGVRKDIDPSGSIAGLMSRIDGSRGVWKAPAGLEGDLRGVLGVRVPLSDQQNGLLNPQGINVVRRFPNGIVSWGARTMDGFDNSGNTDYRYIPPRRMALFIQESLTRGLAFAVFEPNDEPLWVQVRLAAGAFLNGLFRRGAFAGKTASDAYFVKCDAETTTQSDINLGIVNVRVGFAALKPAEFIVITLQQKAGQVQV